MKFDEYFDRNTSGFEMMFRILLHFYSFNEVVSLHLVTKLGLGQEIY